MDPNVERGEDVMVNILEQHHVALIPEHDIRHFQAVFGAPVHHPEGVMLADGFPLELEYSQVAHESRTYHRENPSAPLRISRNMEDGQAVVSVDNQPLLKHSDYNRGFIRIDEEGITLDAFSRGAIQKGTVHMPAATGTVPVEIITNTTDPQDVSITINQRAPSQDITISGSAVLRLNTPNNMVTLDPGHLTVIEWNANQSYIVPDATHAEFLVSPDNLLRVYRAHGEATDIKFVRDTDIESLTIYPSRQAALAINGNAVVPVVVNNGAGKQILSPELQAEIDETVVAKLQQGFQQPVPSPEAPDTNTGPATPSSPMRR